MRRSLLVALGSVVLLLCGFAAAPAGAIETGSFGLAPAGSSGRTALHEDVRPGGSVDDAVRLWNKTDAPVTVRLEVQGASLDDGGQVSLGGNEGAAGWVRLSRDRVTIPARGSVEVPLTTTAPRTMPGGTTTAAIVAQVDGAGPGGNVSVVQRVALMVYVKAPVGAGLKAALGWAAWVAAALLVAVAAGLALMRRRRPQEPSVPHRFRRASTAV